MQLLLPLLSFRTLVRFDFLYFLCLVLVLANLVCLLMLFDSPFFAFFEHFKICVSRFCSMKIFWDVLRPILIWVSLVRLSNIAGLLSPEC